MRKLEKISLKIRSEDIGVFIYLVINEYKSIFI